MEDKPLDERKPILDQASGGGADPQGARSANQGATTTPDGGALVLGQRWSMRRKLAVVQRLITGEALELVSREVGVPIYQLEDWRDKALAGMEEALKVNAQDPTARKLAEAQRQIGELTMQNELLRERCRRAAGPLARGKSSK